MLGLRVDAAAPGSYLDLLGDGHWHALIVAQQVGQTAQHRLSGERQTVTAANHTSVRPQWALLLICNITSLPVTRMSEGTSYPLYM